LRTVPIYAENNTSRLISTGLLSLLKQLDDHVLALNVLRPLTVDRETQVRQNLLTWVENIQNRPDLPLKTEQRLLTLFAQLIEEKFKTLTYKELSQMLQLTPLKETESVREIRHEDRIELLTKQIRHKFRFAESTVERLIFRLQQLSLHDLDDLFEVILDMRTLKQLNAWIDERLPQTEPH